MGTAEALAAIDELRRCGRIFTQLSMLIAAEEDDVARKRSALTGVQCDAARLCALSQEASTCFKLADALERTLKSTVQSG
jgi:hypothetical protein